MRFSFCLVPQSWLNCGLGHTLCFAKLIEVTISAGCLQQSNVHQNMPIAQRNVLKKSEAFKRVWDYFTVNPEMNKSGCNLCPAMLSGKIATNCKKHLRTQHKIFLH
jgi:hypothetical protein